MRFREWADFYFLPSFLVPSFIFGSSLSCVVLSYCRFLGHWAVLFVEVFCYRRACSWKFTTDVKTVGLQVFPWTRHLSDPTDSHSVPAWMQSIQRSTVLHQSPLPADTPDQPIAQESRNISIPGKQRAPGKQGESLSFRQQSNPFLFE